MKVSCILTSFNRPKWVRDSIRSIESQTHQDLQLVVIDESETFDITETLKEFSFNELIVRHSKVAPEVRRLTNRLSENCNLGLSLATGDLVCFLADDDYYYPGWFSAAVAWFERNPSVQAAFGKLVYSYTGKTEFPKNPDRSVVRFYEDPVDEPFGKLDHNQVIHRRFDPPFQWPAGASTIGGPDAFYFREIAQKHRFHPIDALAAVKRIHCKGLMESQQIYINGFMEGLRE
jgi:glycosyltransferase involved in cell wall biosynthesis